jgi:hypothetical protein
MIIYSERIPLVDSYLREQGCRCPRSFRDAIFLSSDWCCCELFWTRSEVVYPSVRARTKFINSLYTYNFDIGRRFTGFRFVWLYKMKDLLKIDWNQRGPRKSRSTFSPAHIATNQKKVSFTSLQRSTESNFPSQTRKAAALPPSSFKTVYITSCPDYKRFSKVVLTI